MLQLGNAIVYVASTAKSMNPINACNPGQGSEEVHAHTCRALCQIGGRSVWTCHETNNIWQLVTEPDSGISQGNSNRARAIRNQCPATELGEDARRRATAVPVNNSDCVTAMPCREELKPASRSCSRRDVAPGCCRQRGASVVAWDRQEEQS